MNRSRINCYKLLAAAAILLSFGMTAFAQDWPTKPVRVIVPFPPGGSTDLLARILAQKLTEKWGQQVIVDNRPGGNTLIAAQAAAVAPGDGYTLFMPIDFTLTMNQTLYSKLPYDPVADFKPITILTEQSMLIAINPKVPAKNLAEFVSYAKANPGKISYGTGAVSAQVAGEMFKRMAGIDMVHVPFKGSAPALQALLAGDLDMTVSDLLPYIPHLKEGKLRGLATTGSTRAESLPELPTVAASGYKDFYFRSWFALVAPSATPENLARKIGDDVRAVIKTPEIKAKLADVGLEVVGGSEAQFQATLKRETATYGKTIKEAGIRLD
jgi:tripartite-type tricarboxylate transporter receptor subunit TctC